jgi:hypothetical protein
MGGAHLIEGGGVVRESDRASRIDYHPRVIRSRSQMAMPGRSIRRLA